MFNNIGTKLRALAIVFFVLCLLSSIGGAVTCFIYFDNVLAGVGVLVGGFILAFIVAGPLYCLGDTNEEVYSMQNKLDSLNQELLQLNIAIEALNQKTAAKTINTQPETGRTGSTQMPAAKAVDRTSLLTNGTQEQAPLNEKGTMDLSPHSTFSADSNLAHIYNVVLYTLDDADFSTEFSATLSDGKLVFSGQDFGPAVEKRWGDWDYEYWYSFDREETAKLLAAINADRDPEAALLRAFGGQAGENKLRALCEARGILYKFTSHV